MTKVYCDKDTCANNKEGICSLESVAITADDCGVFYCSDFVGIEEEDTHD